jgi:hypothetical protein
MTSLDFIVINHMTGLIHEIEFSRIPPPYVIYFSFHKSNQIYKGILNNQIK